MRNICGFHLALATLAVALFLPVSAAAHCDTLGGPVIADARTALEKRDVTPVLKWLKPEYEPEIRTAFTKTLRVRAQGPEARELADNYFFETLVRLHRAGEGAPYTGLKPADAAEPIIVATDQALAAGDLDGLVKRLQADVAEGVRQRFARVLAARKHANDSVAEGRRYVAAYIELTHYIETLHATGGGEEPDHQAQAAGRVHGRAE